LPEGKYASDRAIKVFAHEFFPAADDSNNVPSRLERALYRTNEFLFAESRARQIKFGTTLTAAHIWNGYVDFIHVGDTALWRIDFRAETVDVLTRADTLEREHLQRGESRFYASQYKNVLTQALGLSAHISPQVGRVQLHSQDVLVLSTDGFYASVSTSEVM